MASLGSSYALAPSSVELRGMALAFLRRTMPPGFALDFKRWPRFMCPFLSASGCARGLGQPLSYSGDTTFTSTDWSFIILSLSLAGPRWGLTSFSETELQTAGHSKMRMISPVIAGDSPTDAQLGFAAVPSFEALYQEHFAFVWRTLWRLGVWQASVADAAQDVFLVVYRRHADLLGSDVARSWVYGIVVRVARDYRRGQLRKGLPVGPDPDELGDPQATNAAQRLEQQEAVIVLNRLLDTLDDEKREVLVLVELEQMTVPEIAELLTVNPNTIYTRLRAARQDFARALARQRAAERKQP